MRLRVHPKAWFKNNLTEALQSGIIRLVSEIEIFGDEDENADGSPEKGSKYNYFRLLSVMELLRG